MLNCSDMDTADLPPRSRCPTQPSPLYKPRLPQRLAPLPPASPHLRPSRRTSTPPHTLLSSRPLRTTTRLFSLLCLGCPIVYQLRNTRPAASPPAGLPIPPRQPHPQRLALRPLPLARQRAPPAQTLHHPGLAHQPRAARPPHTAPRGRSRRDRQSPRRAHHHWLGTRGQPGRSAHLGTQRTHCSRPGKDLRRRSTGHAGAGDAPSTKH